MADLTMCTGNCPMKEKCYRYMAKPNRYGQSYSCLEDICIPNDYQEFIPYDNPLDKTKECKTTYTLHDFIFDEIQKKRKTN